MLRCKKHFLTACLALLALTAGAARAEDAKGSRDHPLISRYPGSSIMAYDLKDFSEYTLPLGKMLKQKLSKDQKLEGKIFQITYAAPEGRSLLEVFRNYETALKEAGFAILFSGRKAELGDGWLQELIKATARAEQYGGAGLETRLADDFMYLAARLDRPEGEVYLSLTVGSSWFQRFPVVQLDIIEAKPMDSGLIKVNAEALAKDIDRIGHAAIYGIYFDTGKAEVKPQSEEALAEIAKLLKLDPNLNLYVVGHTDNVGNFASNMDLSLRRAESVVRVLVSKYGVAANRLQAAGVGPLSPVLANKAEEGRAKNRRVELVKQ